VRVTNAPELLGIPQVARRENVKPLALQYRVLLHLRQLLRLGREAAAKISDRCSLRTCDSGSRDVLVSAVGRKQNRLQSDKSQQSLDGCCAHGIPPIPRSRSAPRGAIDAMRSFCCW